MDCCAKTVLVTYKSLNSVIEQIENLIKSKVKRSFYDYSSTYSQAQKILELVNVKDDLIDLCLLTKDAISKLNSQDRQHIEYKYLNVLPNNEFDRTSRQYFRRQIKAFNNFCEKLIESGFDKDKFLNVYLKIPYIYQAYVKICSQEDKRAAV